MLLTGGVLGSMVIVNTPPSSVVLATGSAAPPLLTVSGTAGNSPPSTCRPETAASVTAAGKTIVTWPPLSPVKHRPNGAPGCPLAVTAAGDSAALSENARPWSVKLVPRVAGGPAQTAVSRGPGSAT